MVAGLEGWRVGGVRLMAVTPAVCSASEEWAAGVGGRGGTPV